MTLCRLLPLLVVLLAPIPVPGAAADDQITHTLLEFVAASCRGWEASGAPAPTWGDGAFSNSDILFRGRRVGTRFRSQTGDDMRVELEVIAPGGRPTRFIGLLFNAFGDPLPPVASTTRSERKVSTSPVCWSSAYRPRHRSSCAYPSLPVVMRSIA